MADDLEILTNKLERLVADLPNEIVEEVMTEVGVQAKKDIDSAVKLDLGGDNRFSGWRRAVLNAGFEHTAKGAITIEPRKASRGPFVVAEQGRWPGSKVAGKKVRRRRYAWGPTRGKNTWTDASNEIVEQTPGRALEQFAKILGGRF